MKTKLILAFVIAGAMSFSACTKKVDEKTMNDINQLEKDWTALGEKGTTWSQQVSETSAKAKEFAQKQNEMMTKMANSKDEAMKNKMTEMTKMSNDNVSKLENM